MKKRFGYFRMLMLILFIIILFPFGIKTTFAKFSDSYVTEDDVVGLDLNFDLSFSNLEEYEKLKIDANSYEIFNVNIFNSTSVNIYYGVWYKMVTPKEVNSSIQIARLEDNETSMSGELESLKDKTVSVIIKNNSSNDIVVNIGVASSEVSGQAIEYLGGKHLITGISKEVDYFYDDTLKKYVSSRDENISFVLDSINFTSNSNAFGYTSNHLGSYLIEAWGAKNKKGDNGAYAKGVLDLNEGEALYFSVGKKNDEDGSTLIGVTPYDKDSKNIDGIMIAGTTRESSYVSGLFGMITHRFDDDELKKLCQTGRESVTCSYHVSGKVFRRPRVIDGTSEMNSIDGRNMMIGNDGDGYVRITPVVPNILMEKTKVMVGEQLDVDAITCYDNGGGCHLVRVVPEDISNLALGMHDISLMVSDNQGIVYQYKKQIEVVER